MSELISKDPAAVPKAADPHGMTILQTTGRLLAAKAYSVTAGGVVSRTPHANAKQVIPRWATVRDIHDLHTGLLKLERAPQSFVIRGAYPDGTPATRTSRKLVKGGGPVQDVPRIYAMFDIDGAPAPVGSDLLNDPRDTAERIADMLVQHAPDLAGVSMIVQHTSSAGIADRAEAERVAGTGFNWAGLMKRDPAPTVSAHVWVLLTEAQDGAALTRWAAAVNDRAGFKLVDPATFTANQPHFTAAPVFDAALGDHLAGRRTHLIEGEADAATLTIPPIPPRVAWVPKAGSEAGSGATGGRGYAARIEAIGGPGGFHEPMKAAVGAYVAATWPAPDLAVVVADVASRVQVMGPGQRDAGTVARYSSAEFIAGIFNHCCAMEAMKAEAKAAAAAVPVVPTYPAGKAMSLRAAEGQMAEATYRFAMQVNEGMAPALLVSVTVGGGKTRGGIAALPMLQTCGKVVGGRGILLFTHPRHELGDKIAADIRATTGLKVAVWRGMDAADPANPGKNMCTVPALPEAARKAGMDSQHGCDVCPQRAGCAYFAQMALGAGADVWVAPHHVLTRKPFGGWPRMTVEDGRQKPIRPATVLVDEDPTPAWVAGMGDNAIVLPIDADSVAFWPVGDLNAADATRLQTYRAAVTAALHQHLPGLAFRNVLARSTARRGPGRTPRAIVRGR